jgi:hypothetical protein
MVITSWSDQLEDLLWIESAEKYDCVDSMVAVLMSEFSDEDQEMHCDDICDRIREWWRSHTVHQQAGLYDQA